MSFCDCCKFSIHDKGYCEYCAIVDTGFTFEDNNVKLSMLNIPCVCIEHKKPKAKKIKNLYDKDGEETKAKKNFGT